MTQANPVSATQWVDTSLRTALELGASDVHFEPGRHRFTIRMRCDGLLHQFRQTGMTLAPAIIARLKILGDLDIAEKRRPQDGRCRLSGRNRESDARISTLPALYGEKIVVRLLSTDTRRLSLQALQMPTPQCTAYRAALARPQGIILVAGPTGAGKTTSLYAGVQEKMRPELSIATVEDPVEITLPGVTQVAVKPALGLDFAQCLRALLRQDPDVILVGEIRDRETASIALHAAQTGHLVLSSLHAGSALEAISRLRNLGIAAGDLAHTLNLVMAQRLVRRLCPDCQHADASPGIGCPACLNGYRGRIGLYEQLIPTPDAPGSPPRLEAPAQSLWAVGRNLVETGLTSLAELTRVLGPEDRSDATP